MSREPSLRALQAGLTRTTEALACELARPASTAPDWSPLEWQLARAVASIHGVSSLLAQRLRWSGPPGWQQFLAEQRSQTLARHARIEQLLAHIAARAADAGLPLMLLKGAALHAAGFYAAGERPMADVDLLAAPDDGALAGRVLEACGCREAPGSWKHRVFESGPRCAPARLGEHAADAVNVELHSQLFERLPLRTVDLSVLAWPGRPGLNGYPGRRLLLLHLLLHASGTLIFRAVRLVQLEDIARVCARMSAADWAVLAHHGAAADEPALWWAYAPLALTQRYYGCVPGEVLAQARSDCHWMLRRSAARSTLSDSSLSRLWISAFPGIEWSRSMREMLAYGAGRLWPSRETRAERHRVARVMHDTSPGSWSQLPQRRRIARFVLARPARPESLRPVQAALATCP